MITIVSTRFTNATWNQNAEYRRANNCCIYGSPQTMTDTVEYEGAVFVVEMNNDHNRIEGIGLIRNKPLLNKYYNIYSNGNYNRYVYRGEHHVGQEVISRYNPVLLEALNYILFKGKTHSKRGAGFKNVTLKLMKQERFQQIDFVKEIRELFIKVYRPS